MKIRIEKGEGRDRSRDKEKRKSIKKTKSTKGSIHQRETEQTGKVKRGKKEDLGKHIEERTR